MDLQTDLTQIESWPIEDRGRLMDRIWDGLLDQGSDPELTEAQMSELDRRLEEDDAMPDDMISWEEVKTEALRRAGRSSSYWR